MRSSAELDRPVGTPAAEPSASSSASSAPPSDSGASDRSPEAARAEMPERATPPAGTAGGSGSAPGSPPPVLDAAALVAAPPVPLPEGSGMVAVIDPVTGEMRSPTAEEIRANFPELREPPGAPPTFPLPGGGVGADLSAGHGRNVSVATWSPSEGVRHHCMQADCPHPSHVSGAAAPSATSTSSSDPSPSDPSPESPR